jgi:hypothetical protein
MVLPHADRPGAVGDSLQFLFRKALWRAVQLSQRIQR